jgi:hypothetical protein
MDEPPRDDVTREVDRRSADLTQRWSGFTAQPAAARLVMAVALAAAIPVAAALVLFIALDSTDGAAVFAVVGVAVISLGAAVWAALDPVGYLRTITRHGASYPTSAPGYGKPEDR